MTWLGAEHHARCVTGPGADEIPNGRATGGKGENNSRFESDYPTMMGGAFGVDLG